MGIKEQPMPLNFIHLMDGSFAYVNYLAIIV
jgi:hypothetical protein